jgi:hypothetical protein
MDRDNALILWLTELGQGRYPYATRTHLGNRISPLPLMPLLVLPFHLLGNVGYLQIFAYLLLVPILASTYRRAPRAQFLSICILSTAPLLFVDVIGRSDLIANMVLLVVIVYWLEAHEGRPWRTDAYVLGVLLGCFCATRLGLWSALGVLMPYLWRLPSHGTFFRVAAAATIVFALLVVPFVLWDAETFFRFAPFGVSSTKLGKSIAAPLGWGLLTGMVALGSGLALKRASHLYAGVSGALALMIVATRLGPHWDPTYCQFVFVPLLMALPRCESPAVGGCDVR